jgi:hypothetical protein
MSTRSGQATNPSLRRFREKNRPPQGEPWVWFTLDVFQSDAWSAMPLCARRVVERVMIEHMQHGGKDNGSLPVTYDDFQAYGIRRASIKQGISISQELGWIDIVQPGLRGHGIARRATRYGLTWLPRSDWTPASDRWRAVTPEAAQQVLRRQRLDPAVSTDQQPRYRRHLRVLSR